LARSAGALDTRRGEMSEPDLEAAEHVEPEPGILHAPGEVEEAIVGGSLREGTQKVRGAILLALHPELGREGGRLRVTRYLVDHFLAALDAEEHRVLHRPRGILRVPEAGAGEIGADDAHPQCPQ